MILSLLTNEDEAGDAQILHSVSGYVNGWVAVFDVDDDVELAGPPPLIQATSCLGCGAARWSLHLSTRDDSPTASSSY